MAEAPSNNPHGPKENVSDVSGPNKKVQFAAADGNEPSKSADIPAPSAPPAPPLVPALKASHHASSTLAKADMWNVTSLPPVNSVKGHVVPRAVILKTPGHSQRRRRRISIEVHMVLPPYVEDSDDESSDEEDEEQDDTTTRRDEILQRIQSMGFGKKKGKSSKKMEPVEKAFIRILKPPKRKNQASIGIKAAARAINIANAIKKHEEAKKRELETTDGNESDSDSSHDSDASSVGFVDDANDMDDKDDLGDSTAEERWRTKYKLQLADVTVKRRVKNSIVLNTQRKYCDVKTREYIFDTELEAIDFESKMKKQKALSVERDAKRLKAALGSIELKDNGEEMLELLIEIVGGVNLPVFDVTSSDPYVSVKFNGQTVHKTDYVSKCLNPIWTVKTGSLFIFKVKAKELFQSFDGLCMEVKDYDAYSSNEVMGAVKIPPKFLYRATEERREFRLKPGGNHSKTSGKLALRCRRATEYDKNFLEEYKLAAAKESKKKDPVKLRAAANAVKNVGTNVGKEGGIYVTTVTEKRKKKEKINGQTVVKYKVRPGPDPKRVTQTTFMTDEDIQKESMKESLVWQDAGSGMLGKVFVEIISCTGLPNLDLNLGFDRNKTDAFVKIVYEDCICKTDTIMDCLSPVWLPWSNRAFILHTMHTSSPLFIGVFDFDNGIHDAVDNHDPIGRIAVDLSNLRAETVHVMHFQLYEPSRNYGVRKPNGVLKIRLRLEIPDERAYALSSLHPPPDVYVNDKQKKEFRCANFTCKGPNDESFSINTISAYVEELLEYYNLVVYVQDALISVILWRGHYETTIRIPAKPSEEDTDNGAEGFNRLFQRYTKRIPLKLPLHSATLFVAGVTLVERPSLLPSYICGSIAWFLLATMGFRCNNPNPWGRCKSFRQLMEVLIAGRILDPPPTIVKNQNLDEASSFRKKWEDKIKELEENTQEQKDRAIRELQEEEAIGEADTDLSTKTNGGWGVQNISPLKPVLHPVQLYLAMIVDFVRFIKNVVIWEECYFAFWITCASIILAVFFLFIPWNFIIIWSVRLGAWAGLGPWMKLVDIYYFSKLEDLSKLEKKKLKQKALKAREKYLEELKKDKRLKEEDTRKTKDIKSHLFGKYATHVPILKTERYRYIPLPASTATPYEAKPLSMAQLAIEEAGSNRKRLKGQNLEGVMIPKLADDVNTGIHTGRAVSNTQKLEKGSLAASLLGADTDFAAISKVAQIVLLAIVATWLGVPIINAVVQWTTNGILTFF